ncbi:MAG: hypothetical protein ACP5JG_00575, partial [Anaerolineae bacterium]
AQYRSIWDVIRTLVGRIAPYSFAVIIAAVQVLPTLELARFSARSGGLSWRTAVSFSIAPWTLHRALLPPYLATPLLPEGVGYLGLGGMLLVAVGVGRALRPGDRRGLIWSILMSTGLFLALGGYNPLYFGLVRLGVPGFVHFRAPARFLALYVLGASWLIGFACDGVLTFVSAFRERQLSERGHADAERRGIGFGVRLTTFFIVVTWGAIPVELLFSAQFLPHADATTPRAYTDLRPATAHLVATSRAAALRGGAPNRFLSMTQTLFEIGDRKEIELSYENFLSEGALWSYLVSTKQREVLVPNLPLAFQVPAVDGYDGGLLPLSHYISFSKLLLPEGTIDGRLRENLSTIPDERWLSLMGARFLVTDKTMDAWVDDIFYDRQFRPTLLPEQHLEIGWLPDDFSANALGLLYRGEGGEVVIELASGREVRRRLPSSATDEEAHMLRWSDVDSVTGIAFHATDGPLALAGASLVDERLGAFYPLVLSDRFWLAHSGDVKIYEALSPIPRAFLVPGCRSVASESEALSAMRDPAFDPTRTVVLEAAEGGEDVPACPENVVPDIGSGEVAFVEYAPHRVVIDVTAESPGFLVLTDAWYPGWQVRIEQVSTASPSPTGSASQSPYRADLLFRAIPVETGTWRITYTYRPVLVWVGLSISFVGLGLFVGLAFRWRQDAETRAKGFVFSKR